MASKRHQRRKACSDGPKQKKCFANEKLARDFCSYIRKTTGDRMYPYPCKWVHKGQWHIGHNLKADHRLY